MSPRQQSRLWLTRFALGMLVSVIAAVPLARADDGTSDARSHYEMGLKLFDAREHEQALIEFERANQIKPRPAAVFMMAQCEYLLGRLKGARAHYQAYLTEVPDGEFAALARDRVESIDKRPSTFAINTVPDDVTVRISPEGQTGNVVATGQAPNNFQIPRGRYRVDVTKPNFQGQTRIVEVDIAETKPLFFKLDPIPARLEIETAPAWATLYVNGNRARNPYRQDVAPGHVEIFAEASDYLSRTADFDLAPGERRLLTGDARLRLAYKQRSGRAELLVASAVVGGLVGAGGVAAAIGSRFENGNVSSLLLTTGGAIAGAIAGVLIATPLVPEYIPDNRALFILGGMWIGAAEGAGLGIVGKQIVTASGTAELPCTSPCRGPIGDQLRAGFIGSLPGIAIGLTASGLAGKYAPTYGRVALIQSAALGGAVFGAVTQLATEWKPYGGSWALTVRPSMQDDSIATKTMPATAKSCVPDTQDPPYTHRCAYQETSILDLAPGALIGLNVGLAVGLLGAYLPDQSRYGPTAQRVLLVDLAIAAGAVAGATFGCVAATACLNSGSKPADTDEARATASTAALAGAAIGAVGGVLLTRHYDDDRPDAKPASATTPLVMMMPMRDPSGNMVPAFAAMGFF